MSDGQPKEDGVGLKLVVRKSSESQLVTIQEFFETMVLPFFQKMIPIVEGKKDDVDYDVLEVSDRLEPELRAFLESMSLKKPSREELLENEDWLEKKMVVRLVQDESCYMLVAYAADDAVLDEFAPGKEYYFSPYVFAKGTDNLNPYEGLRYWQIVEMVKEKRGKNSQPAKDVSRVSELTRTLLYNVTIPEREREVMARELYILRMQTGAAAMAVISTFIKGYQGGKWVEVIGFQAKGVSVAEDGSAYYQAMNRLLIGRYDLAKLAGTSLTIFE